jgi:predicted nucleotidyltransferase
MNIYLFGSTSRGDNNDKSDIDIVLFNGTVKEYTRIKKQLSSYVIENGGQLDLFIYNQENCSFDAVFNCERRIDFKYGLIEVQNELKEISLNEIQKLCQNKMHY